MTNERLSEIGNKILQNAESLLGIRQDVSFMGYFVNERYSAPQLTFNFSYYLIEITSLAKFNESEAEFQIAHEVIHLLTPLNTNESPTVFEEGLATYYSFYYLESINKHAIAEKYKAEILEKRLNYLEAYIAVNQIADLFFKVKLIRHQFPALKLSQFKREHFQKLTDDSDLVDLLIEPFKRLQV
jgi:hypothetical protein